MSAVDESLVADAVVALLRDQLPAAVLVGDGGPPYLDESSGPVTDMDPAAGEVASWVVVYVIGPASFPATGWAGQPGMEVVRFQLTGAGPTRSAAQGSATLATAILVDREDGPSYGHVHALVVPGHEIDRREKVDRGPVTEEGGWWNAPQIVDVWAARSV